jgi:hypothetical protein
MYLLHLEWAKQLKFLFLFGFITTGSIQFYFVKTISLVLMAKIVHYVSLCKNT